MLDKGTAIGRQPDKHGFFDEGDQTFCGSIWYPLHPNPSDAFAIRLSSHNNQGFLFRLAASDASFRSAQIGFVHLHHPRQSVASRPHHRAPQLMQPSPGRLIATQSQDALQAECTPPRLLAGQMPHCLKPVSQRFPRALKNRARDQRGLSLACRTSEQTPRRHPA